MRYNTSIFYSIRERVGVPRLLDLTRHPGVQALHRITAYYPDGRARHSVATLYCKAHDETHQLEVIYEGLFQHEPLRYRITQAHYAHLVQTLSHVRFDDLPDQPDLEREQRTLWLVERATGTFQKSVVLSPHTPVLPYCTIVNALDDHLAIREIKK